MRHNGFLIALILGACGNRERLEDAGQVCIGTANPSPDWASDTDEQSIELNTDEPFPISVVFSQCASGSTEWREQSCATTLEGDTLTISSAALTVTPSSQTDDCNFITFDCGETSLSAGSWTVVYGDNSEPIDVPYQGAPICIDGT